MPGSSEVSSRRLVRNTAANASASAVVAVLAVVLTPFFLRRLGPGEYGVWLLATTLTFANGYLGLADLGLQQAGVRIIAEARSRDDVDVVNATVSTMAMLFAVLGVVLGGALAAASSVIANVFEIEPDLRDAATLVFFLVGVQIALDLPGASVLALLEGAQRYGALRVVDVGARVAWAVVAVIVVILGGGVVAMAAASLCVAVVGLGLSAVLAKRIEPRLRVSPALGSRARLRDVMRQGSSLLILRVTSIVYRQMDRAIIGVMLSTVAVARYEVAYKIHATAAVVLSVAPSAVMPAAAYLNAADDRDQLRRLYLRGTKYAIALATPVSVAALLYARPLITTWVGQEYDGLAGATRLFLAYPVLVSVHVVGLTMLVGLGRMREMVLLSPASVVLNLIVSVALTPSMGVVGVIWGTLAGYLVIWFPYLRLMLGAFGVGVAEWARSTIAPNVPGLLVQLVLGAVTLRWAEDLPQLWQVGALVALSGAVNVATFVFLVLGGDERRQLLRAAGRAAPADPGEPSAATPDEDGEAGIVARSLEARPLERPE